MSFADEVLKRARPVTVDPGTSSYWRESEADLDPTIFSQGRIKPWVRNTILRLLFEYLEEQVSGVRHWATVWLAGSAVSFQWSSGMDWDRKDLDCLVGVDYVSFREANPGYRGLSDVEISDHLNQGLYTSLGKRTRDWNGFELTFYVNPGATDITAINPYAAYNLTLDEWTVRPASRDLAAPPPAWALQAQRDHQSATKIAAAYSDAYSAVHNATNPAHRVNAERKLELAMSSAESLYDEIHRQRGVDFSSIGQGYAGPGNYRWQAGKKSGAVPTLRKLRDYAWDAREGLAHATYGIELPDTQTLIVRAALYQD